MKQLLSQIPVKLVLVKLLLFNFPPKLQQPHQKPNILPQLTLKITTNTLLNLQLRRYLAIIKHREFILILPIFQILQSLHQVNTPHNVLLLILHKIDMDEVFFEEGVRAVQLFGLWVLLVQF